MNYLLTNKNIRLRYRLQKEIEVAKGFDFTYQDMAALFRISDRTVYTWVTRVPSMQSLPASKYRRAEILAWLNDGLMAARYGKRYA